MVQVISTANLQCPTSLLTLHMQASLLRDTFLEMDKAITIDEGCTASVLLLERSRSGSGAGTTSWLVQTANVGDSSAVLVDTAG